MLNFTDKLRFCLFAFCLALAAFRIMDRDMPPQARIWKNIILKQQGTLRNHNVGALLHLTFRLTTSSVSLFLPQKHLHRVAWSSTLPYKHHFISKI